MALGTLSPKSECQFYDCGVLNLLFLIWKVEIIILLPQRSNDIVNTMCFEKYEL